MIFPFIDRCVVMSLYLREASLLVAGRKFKEEKQDEKSKPKVYMINNNILFNINNKNQLTMESTFKNFHEVLPRHDEYIFYSIID